MTGPRCKTSMQTIHSFLNATKGNWRNTIYICCDICRWEKETDCGDFLFAPDTKGLPLIVPVSDIDFIWGQYIDRTECLSIMPAVRFLKIFELWVQDIVQDENRCPLLQIQEHYGGEKRMYK